MNKFDYFVIAKHSLRVAVSAPVCSGASLIASTGLLSSQYSSAA